MSSVSRTRLAEDTPELTGFDVDRRFDWRRVARLFLTSRKLDDLEESRLLPEKKILYQFSARGHELGQILLGSLLTHPHDAANAYYRSRPLLLTLGLSPADSLAGGMAKSGSVSDGRDIGAVYNFPRNSGALVLPMAGGVGTQYTTTAGWARAIVYYRDSLHEESYRNSIAVALGGDGSVATNGFWSALNIATTLELPMLFYIEDNGFGLSVPATKQTPGGDIAANLASFRNLKNSFRGRTRPWPDSADSVRCSRMGSNGQRTCAFASEGATSMRPLRSGHAGLQRPGAPGTGKGAGSADRARTVFDSGRVFSR